MDDSSRKKHGPDRRKPRGARRGGGPSGSLGRPTSGLSVRRLHGNEYAIMAPECACDRREDLEEVHSMIEADELDIARDELLYLVADCQGFIEAHNLLAMLALEDGDVAIARGHFGFAYENGLAAVPSGFAGRLPADQEYNRHFFDAGRGLARCLVALDKRVEAREILEQLARFDPREESVQALLAELKNPPAPREDP